MVGLDPQAAFDLKEIMRERSKAGKTVFFSTHVMEVAEKLCDRIAVIDRGQVIFVGKLEELREKRSGGADESLESLFLRMVGNGEGGQK
jgi:ABC-2 type transport system ATP-binding protein